jgi:hypothetical protein
MSVRAGVFSWDLDGREKVVSRGSQAGQAEDEEGPRAKLSQYPATTHKRPARRPLMCHSGRYREMRGGGGQAAAQSTPRHDVVVVVVRC